MLKKYLPLGLFILFSVIAGLLIHFASMLSWGQDEYKPTVITSGSMLPTIKINAFVIVQKYDINLIQVGDIVTYVHPKLGSTTHRVVETGVGYVVTKGDANDVVDDVRVTQKMLQGKVIYIGNWLVKLTTPFMVNGKFNIAWAAVAISVGSLIVLWLCIFITFLFLQVWGFVMVLTGHAYTPTIHQELESTQQFLDIASELNYSHGDTFRQLLKKVRTYNALCGYIHEAKKVVKTL